MLWALPGDRTNGPFAGIVGNTVERKRILPSSNCSPAPARARGAWTGLLQPAKGRNPFRPRTSLPFYRVPWTSLPFKRIALIGDYSGATRPSIRTRFPQNVPPAPPPRQNALRLCAPEVKCSRPGKKKGVKEHRRERSGRRCESVER